MAGIAKYVHEILQASVDALYNQAVLNKAGLAALRIIKDRTRKGRQISGGAFKGGARYSPGHEERRKAAGLPVNLINLEFNDIDGMLQKADHVVFNDYSGVALDIMNERKRRIAYYLSVSGAGKNRVKFPFWGLNEQEEGTVAALIEKELIFNLKKLEGDYGAY
jgi:hypothetical protein